MVDGKTSEYRAVASLQRTKNPVRLARALLPKQVPALLVGKTADELAEKLGLEVVPNSYFTTEKREQYWRANVHKARSLPRTMAPPAASFSTSTGDLPPQTLLGA